jgi:hypothetical protein
VIPAGPCESRDCDARCPEGVIYCPACVAAHRADDLATLRHDAIDTARKIARLRAELTELEVLLATIDARRDAMHAEALGAREAA